MSPGLLSKRLKDMEAKGLIERQSPGGQKHDDYFLTPMGEELVPLVMQLGDWAHRNVARQVSLDVLDARLLMWNIRRKINRVELPVSKAVFQFSLQNPPEETRHYWLVAKPGLEIDLCYTDPHLNVDFLLSQSCAR